MIAQVGTPAWRGRKLLADSDEQRFEIGALGMTGVAWAALAGHIDGAPVEEGEQGAVALHHGIGSQEVLQSRLVKQPRKGYDRGHERCSFQSRVWK